MMDMSNYEERLRKGEKLEDLVNEFARKLSASDTKDRQDREKELKAKAELKTAMKNYLTIFFARRNAKMPDEKFLDTATDLFFKEMERSDAKECTCRKREKDHNSFKDATISEIWDAMDKFL